MEYKNLTVMEIKLKDIIHIGAFVLLVVFLLPQASCQLKNKKMQSIYFYPIEFNDVKLGIDEKEIHPLIPNYPNPDEVLLNQIAINAPQKIIFSSEKIDLELCIPVCGYYLITSRRILKYANQDKLLVHIKKDSDQEWIEGEIVDQPINEHPAAPPWADKQEEEKRKRILEAQKYSDEELNQGQASEDVINVNVMNYVKISLEKGVYEIYLSKSGLESNHVKVEIVFEK